MDLKHKTAIKGRPRLRDKLEKAPDAKVKSDVTLNTWDSYQGWLYLHSFPPTLSDGVKRRLYFMSSQREWDWQSYLELGVPHENQEDPGQGQGVSSSKTRPAILMQVIGELGMDGSPPFEELLSFRTSCFQAMPASMVNTLSISYPPGLRQRLPGPTHLEGLLQGHNWDYVCSDRAGCEAFKNNNRFAARQWWV